MFLQFTPIGAIAAYWLSCPNTQPKYSNYEITCPAGNSSHTGSSSVPFRDDSSRCSTNPTAGLSRPRAATGSNPHSWPSISTAKLGSCWNSNFNDQSGWKNKNENSVPRSRPRAFSTQVQQQTANNHNDPDDLSFVRNRKGRTVDAASNDRPPVPEPNYITCCTDYREELDPGLSVVMTECRMRLCQ